MPLLASRCRTLHNTDWTDCRSLQHDFQYVVTFDQKKGFVLVCWQKNATLPHELFTSGTTVEICLGHLLSPFSSCKTDFRLFVILHLGHTGHASDQQHLPDVTLGHLGVLHGLLTGGHGATDQVSHDAFELRASQLHVEMFRTRGIHGQVWKVDVSLQERISIM